MAAATVLVVGSVATAGTAFAEGPGGWGSVDADAQHGRQGVGVGPVQPEVDWVWDDDTYAVSGGIGGTDTALPGVVDHDGRLLFKSRNTAFDNLEDEPARYDLLALDPDDGTHEVLLTDVQNDYCVPGVAPDGTIWTFQEKNKRTQATFAFARHSAAALVSIDPDTGDIETRYSGPGGDTAGVFGCENGIQFGPDGTVLFKDSPAAGGNLEGTFTPWVRAFTPGGSLKWAQYYDPDDTGRRYRYPWLLVAPEGTPAAGTIYVGYLTNDDEPVLGVAALDPDTGDVIRSQDLPGTAFDTTPAVDPAGGLVFSLEDGHIGNDGHVLRVVDDGTAMSVDWRQDITTDGDRTSGLKGIGRSLQLDGDRVLTFSDTGGHIEAFGAEDGELHWSANVGWTNNSEYAVDAAGYSYFTRLSGGGADAPALDVISPTGDRVGRLLKGQLAAANDGELFSLHTAGPIAGDGSLYVWGGDNNWAKVSDANTARVAGAGRYDTAAQVAMRTFGEEDVETVYLAVGTAFADALTGGPLAAAGQDPLLLVGKNRLPESTSAALQALDPDRVVALGGTGAISQGVLSEATRAAGAVSSDRLSGTNRYATAAAIAEEVTETGVVFLAVGDDYPDTLAAGPATRGAPILLTGSKKLPAETRQALAGMDPDMVVVLGGNGVISPEVEVQAGQVGDAETKRLWGHDRFGTAVAIAEALFPETAAEDEQHFPDDIAFPDTIFDSGTVYVAVGTDYPDATAAAAAAAQDGAPLLLTRRGRVPEVVSRWLEQVGSLQRIVVLGGESAVSANVVQELQGLVD